MKKNGFGMRLPGVLCLALLLGSAAGAEEGKPPVQQAQQFRMKVTKTVRLDYLLFLPKGYEADKKKKWPLASSSTAPASAATA